MDEYIFSVIQSVGKLQKASHPILISKFKNSIIIIFYLNFFILCIREFFFLFLHGLQKNIPSSEVSFILIDLCFV